MKRIVVCDLGNVVFRTDVAPALACWAKATQRPPSHFADAFAVNAAHAAFERGELSEEQFYQDFCIRYAVSLTPVDFATGWCAIYGEPIAGISLLLSDLSERTRLVALTNTNALHYTVWPTRYATLLRSFSAVYCSHLIGARKPAAEAYRYVLFHEGIDPDEAVFLDDLLENVAGARAVGMAAVHVEEDDTADTLLAKLHL